MLVMVLVGLMLAISGILCGPFVAGTEISDLQFFSSATATGIGLGLAIIALALSLGG